MVQLFQLQVVIEWITASELDTAGFRIYRALKPEGPFENISSDLITSSADPLLGGSYEFTDSDVHANQRYYYQLFEIETGGKENFLGETSVLPKRTGWLEGIAGAVLVLVGVFLSKLPAQK